MEIGNKEKKINDTSEPVGISGTRTILYQMINCICKIKVDQSTGTGFFGKINYGKNQTKQFLMTNFHVLNKNYYDKTIKIDLLINDEKIIKLIDLSKKRETYFNENYDVILIEILDNDGIENFLELDENLFREKEDVLYKQKSIYVLQYPNGKNAAVSYGILKSFDEVNHSNILHNCSTEKGSSGSPILNLETNKVIGIHKGGSAIFNFNMGTFLKLPINDFIENKLNKEEAINNNINNIQNLSLKKNNFNNLMNIKKIEDKINNEMNIQEPKINITFDEKTIKETKSNFKIDNNTEQNITVKKQKKNTHSRGTSTKIIDTDNTNIVLSRCQNDLKTQKEKDERQNNDYNNLYNKYNNLEGKFKAIEEEKNCWKKK